jgi:hypothetical protein
MTSKQQRCPYRARHWRIVPRTVGVRSPVCTDCGSPNPKPLTDQEWNEVLAHASFGSVGAHIRDAIDSRDGKVPFCRKHVIALTARDLQLHAGCSLVWQAKGESQ